MLFRLQFLLLIWSSQLARSVGIILMEEEMKIFSEVVFSKFDRVELGQCPSDSEMHSNIKNNFFERSDEISLNIFDKANYVDNDLISVRADRNKASEKNVKYKKICGSILSILVERSKAVFVAQ